MTGHRWSNSGWYMLAKNDSRSVKIPYWEVKVEQGMAVYDEREFIEPDLVGKNSKPNQKGQDAVLIDVRDSFGPVTCCNAMSNAPRRRHVGERPELSKIQALADFLASGLADSGTGTQIVEEYSELAKHLPPRY